MTSHEIRASDRGRFTESASVVVAIPAGGARASGMPVETITDSGTVVSRAHHSGSARLERRELTGHEQTLLTIVVAGITLISHEHAGPEAASAAGVGAYYALRAIVRRSRKRLP